MLFRAAQSVVFFVGLAAGQAATTPPEAPGAKPMVTANFPLGPGDVYVPNGGYFSATNFLLITYIAFAYSARNVTMEFIAATQAGMGSSGRPVFDRTGMTGNFDVSMEWAPEVNCPPGAECQPDSVEVLVLDHVEHPSGN